jgi:murein DD-endopeptidase MepM/ murein hydrolase activator NlpD
VAAEAQAAAAATAAAAKAAEGEGDGVEAGAGAGGGGAPSALEKAGLRKLSIRMDGPLERSIVGAAGRTVGLPLTQVVVRALVWWVNVPSDFRKGDRLDVLYEERAGEEPLVYAVRFQSGRLGRLARAYRFQPAGARFSRFYQPDGGELEMRLADSPLDDYEQITSLLRDGRGHKGVDFKTPSGSPVKSTFEGTILRKTWNFRMNGNSLEVKEDGGDGRSALFLHCSEIAAASVPGAHVKRGQVIAMSGNTGHSFAPHLHYQLASPGHPVLDPFTASPTTRRSLPAGDTRSFEAEVRRLDGLLDAGNPPKI